MKRVVFFFLLLFPLTVEAKVLYGDGASGNDAVSYANSPYQPWRTLGRAVWRQATRSAPYPGPSTGQAAKAGGTVIVSNVPTYTPVNFGMAGSPIVIKGERRVALQVNACFAISLKNHLKKAFSCWR